MHLLAKPWTRLQNPQAALMPNDRVGGIIAGSYRRKVPQRAVRDTAPNERRSIWRRALAAGVPRTVAAREKPTNVGAPHK